MRRRDWLGGAGAIAISVGLPPFASSFDGATAPPVRPAIGFDGRRFSTHYSVRLGVLTGPTDLVEVHRKARYAMDNIDRAMSTFRSDSEIVQLNRSAAGDWTTVCSDTAVTLTEAQRVGRWSSGAFDPTVGPLVELWGFGSTGFRRFPDDLDVIVAQKRVDATAIEIDPHRLRVRKLRDGIELDLCGIAKGLAVDRIAEVLDGNDIENYLVDVGGELRARGVGPGGRPWRVAIEHPSGRTSNPARVFALDNGAVATSGDYRNFFVHGGRRHSHCVDPRLGRPVSHGLSSVTVLAESALSADAMSTALMVLGPDEALDLANQSGIAARLLVRSDDGFVERLSTRFPARAST